MAVSYDTQKVYPEDLETHRPALVGYCYRMLGSSFEADDAVQETMVRAWRAIDGFEARSSLRSWLYRIATNVCLDMLRSRKRRAQPMDTGPAGTVATFRDVRRAESTWIQPLPDARLSVRHDDNDPAYLVENRDSIRLAFITALQCLPPRQRAVLILREVLSWPATEVAQLLDTSVPSVNSALQRARATLAARRQNIAAPTDSTDLPALLDRYVDAFERFDIPALVSLIHEDAVMSMPPWDFWLQGRHEVARWFRGPGAECQGSRLVATAANGCPAFGSYRADPQGGHCPWAIQVLEISGDQIIGHHNFVEPDLFATFGLPDHLS